MEQYDKNKQNPSESRINPNTRTEVNCEDQPPISRYISSRKKNVIQEMNIMKFNGYRKHLMNGENENSSTSIYDTGYNQGQKDLFVPMAVVGIVCGVLGWIFGVAM